MPMNPADMYFAGIQGVIALIMLFNRADLGVPAGFVTFLVIMLLASAIWDFFD